MDEDPQQVMSPRTRTSKEGAMNSTSIKTGLDERSN